MRIQIHKNNQASLTMPAEEWFALADALNNPDPEATREMQATLHLVGYLTELRNQTHRTPQLVNLLDHLPTNFVQITD